MKKFALAAAFIAGIIVCLAGLSLFGFKEEPTVNKNTAAFGPTPPPSIPAGMSFAGEAVPLERWDIREQLDRELIHNYYQPGNIYYMLKLSARHFPQIEAQLKANNIPDDFKYLCVAESNIQNLVSKVGATGFWQFMKGTAPGYNLEVSPSVDERYHVAKSTDAACAYLKSAYNKFGNWTAAAASYNCGMGGYNERSTFQGTTNYYDLVLHEETQRYIFRILAFKHLLGNADSLGFKLPASAGYEPLKTKKLQVTQSISNLSSFAVSNGTNYKILRWLNPWLRGKSLTVRPGKTYEIVLPAE
ncbi:MAG: lytic transglycosylase domain-containing protein [Ferruginibacter sp.]|nr:lytic transglycosylase domain-containing protein [Ferruginibacter sp.]